MRHPILIHPDPRLRKSCAPVPEVTPEIRGLLDDMLDTMYAAPGIGLAAPQIGVDARVVVMDCAGRGEEPAPPEPVCLVNPEIVWSADDVEPHEEGCLSIPDVFAPVTRPIAVRVRYLDRDGVAQEVDYDGIWARCVQHEIDHLDGKLFIDYLGAVRRHMITSKMKKLKRDRARSRD